MNLSPRSVEAVSASPVHGFSKKPQLAIELLEGLGVRGDAHCGESIQHLYLKRKDPNAPNRMQVHLLQAELLDELTAKGFQVAAGQLGENILTRGIDLLALPQGTRIYLGANAVVELTCLRQPCVKIDRFRSGMQREMYAGAGSPVRYRVGVMGVVIQGGTVAPGDTLRCRLPAEPHRVLTT